MFFWHLWNVCNYRIFGLKSSHYYAAPPRSIIPLSSERVCHLKDLIHSESINVLVCFFPNSRQHLSEPADFIRFDFLIVFHYLRLAKTVELHTGRTVWYTISASQRHHKIELANCRKSLRCIKLRACFYQDTPKYNSKSSKGTCFPRNSPIRSCYLMKRDSYHYRFLALF